MEQIIKELKLADDTLAYDGYKTWCHTRIAIAQAIDLLQKQLLQQASVSGALPDDSELEDWLFDGYERNDKNIERLRIGKLVRDRIILNLNGDNDR